MSEKRIDFDEDGLDDVAITGVTLFRLERMDDNSFWIRVYCADGQDVVIWLNADGKIVGRHEIETRKV